MIVVSNFSAKLTSHDGVKRINVLIFGAILQSTKSHVHF